VSWYSNRIGKPSTDDKAIGYWVFAPLLTSTREKQEAAEAEKVKQ
jgi:hypothetical protein